MSTKTSIEWTDATWNPIRGCSRVSAGCQHCYAEAVAARFSGPGQAYEGLARRRSNGEPQWTGEIRFVESKLRDPLKWRAPRRVFVNSMSDLFHEKVSDATLDRIFAVMALCAALGKGHVFQILTKRPERMRAWSAGDSLASRESMVMDFAAQIGRVVWDSRGNDYWKYSSTPSQKNRFAWPGWPLPNVWLGVSVENQETANERIPLLLETPAAIRFLSCEPLLGPIDLDYPNVDLDDGATINAFNFEAGPLCYDVDARPKINWVIAGGESGKGARPMELQWARSIVTQCRTAKVPVFVKQLGRHPIERTNGFVTWPEYDLRDKKGGNMDEWPADLRVREFPGVNREMFSRGAAR